MGYPFKCEGCGYAWVSNRPGVLRCVSCGKSAVVGVTLPKVGIRRRAVGGHPRKFWYTYGDIAVAKGVSIHAVRSAAQHKILVPGDLGSVMNYIGRVRRGGARVRKGVKP